MKPKLYLAGPITGSSFEAVTQWRDLFIEIVGDELDCYSPLRDKDYLSQESSLASDYSDYLLSSQAGIMTRDHFDVKNCDAVVLNLLAATKISIGSMIEVGMAFAYRKPLILVIEPDNLHQHPMLFEAARNGYITDTLEDAAYCATSLLLPQRQVTYRVPA